MSTEEECPLLEEIEGHEMLVLTPEESVWFINLLMQPPREPSEALMRAAARHRELFGTEVNTVKDIESA